VAEKACTFCKVTRPVSEFYNGYQGKHSVAARCKQCYREKARVRYYSKIRPTKDASRLRAPYKKSEDQDW
jgi:hypothetical protein